MPDPSRTRPPSPNALPYGTALALLLWLAASCYGTTSIVVITSEGIVAGTDHLIRQIRLDRAANAQTPSINKIELIKQRFLVSSIGIERIDDVAGTVVYNFSDWIKSIGNRVNANTTVTEFVSVIEKEADTILRSKLAIETRMRSGELVQDAMQNTIVEYIVAGYEKGVATAIRVYFQFDWQNKRLIGPVRQYQFPVAGSDPSFGVQLNGVMCGISEFTDPRSYAYDSFYSYSPGALDKFVKHKVDNIEDAIMAIRVLISIQAKITPNQVGSSSRVVIVPMHGSASVTQYPGMPLLRKPKNTK